MTREKVKALIAMTALVVSPTGGFYLSTAVIVSRSTSLVPDEKSTERICFSPEAVGR